MIPSNVAVEYVHRRHDGGRISSSTKLFWVGKFPAIPDGNFRVKGAYDEQGIKSFDSTSSLLFEFYIEWFQYSDW